MKLKKRLLHFYEIYRPLTWAFLLLVAIIACSQVLSLTPPFLYSKVFDGLIAGESVRELMNYALMLLGVLFLKSIVERIHGHVHVGHIGFDVEERIADVTLQKISKLSLGQITNHNSGFKHDIIKKGEAAIAEMVELIVFEATPIILRVTIALTALFTLSVYLGVITLGSLILFVASSFIINKKMTPGLKKHNKKGNRISTIHWEIIKHLRLVIIHNQEERARREYREHHKQYSTEGKKLWFSYFDRVTWFREPFASIGQCAVLAAGIILAQNGSITVGKLMMVMAWSGAAFGTLGNVGSLQRRVVRHSVHVGRYFELLEIPPAVTVVENPIRPERFRGEIEFRNVSFEYPVFKRDELEEDKQDSEGTKRQSIVVVSFTVKAGTTCAFVGHSGAGKSTVINLLLRGYDPQSGQILIDGHDLRLLDLGHWRKSVGCVEQDPKLWDDTLRYNMTYGLNGEAHTITDHELEELAHKTRISEFYTRLGEKRFDTEIGENGVQLSGGQRQRVAIARAIAKSPSLIILDEATNALDPVNEHFIHQAIKEALVGRTGIIIAHRLSTIRHADQIVVFEEGRIVGVGKHEELIHSCDAYQALVEREVGTLTI